MLDDDDAWMAKALEDPYLLAAELFFFARPAERVPWQSLVDNRPRPRSPPRWGGRRRRSRPSLHKEPSSTWSPTTPLSWSGCGGGGGSASSAGAEKVKRRRDEAGTAADGSAVKVEMQGAENRVVGMMNPQVAAKRRQGKKKLTLPELRDLERVLLDEREQLKRELEHKRSSYRLLMVENEHLKSLTLGRTTEIEERRCLPFDLNLDLADELEAAY